MVSQTFAPDPAAVGQYMAEVAAELVGRGARVRVITQDRGYEDPSVRYKRRETYRGVDVVRLPLASFGKTSIARRLAGGLSFSAQSIARAVLGEKPDALIVTTSPPMGPLVGLLARELREVPMTYWAMDLNPDQVLALGVMPPHHPAVLAMHAMNALVMRRASAIVALDKFMAERLRAKGAPQDKLFIVPPWPLDDYLEPVPHATNPFRRMHGLDGKRVFMFSGNMSIASPIATILDIAMRLEHRDDIRFVLVGGGLEKKRVEALIADKRPPNVMLLPYQPLETLKNSLSAADVHLVALGDPMVGIVHPCKLYGAMAVARPTLYIGPSPSHISEIVDGAGIGWSIRNGDVDGGVQLVERIAAMTDEELQAMGVKAREAVAPFAKTKLAATFCDIVERTIL